MGEAAAEGRVFPFIFFLFNELVLELVELINFVVFVVASEALLDETRNLVLVVA